MDQMKYFTTIFMVFSLKYIYCLTLYATHDICVRDIRAINPFHDRTDRTDDKTRICCRQNRGTSDSHIYIM